MQTNLAPARPRTLQERILRGRWIGKILLILLLGYATWAIGRQAVASPALFAEQVKNGLQLGFVYAMIALGYTMVYGIVRLINFAHGDVFMVGAFVSYFAISRVNLHLWLASLAPGLPEGVSLLVGTLTVVILAMVTCAFLAVVIERMAYKPLRTAPRISALITVIGVSFFLEYFGALDSCSAPTSSPTSARSRSRSGTSRAASTPWSQAARRRRAACCSQTSSSLSPCPRSSCWFF